MSTADVLIGRGLRSAQPTPASGAAGQLYYVTDELKLERWSGSAWQAVSVGVAADAIFNAAGDLVVGTGADTAARLAIGTNGYVLTSNGTTAVWAAAASGAVATDAIWDAAGDLALGTGANTAAKLAIGTSGYVLTSNGTTAAWAASAGGSGGVPGDGPAAPSGAGDDEFDTPDTTPFANWTVLGSPTAHDIDTTAADRYYVKWNAGTSGWGGIYKAVPSMPFTVTALLSGCSAQGDYSSAGLFIGEATPGKMEVVGFAHGNLPRGYMMEYFTNPTTYAGTAGYTVANRPKKVFMKIVVASSTDVSYYVSEDGFTWVTITTARNPGFTVASVGLAAKCENGTYANEAVFEWIRFT